MKKTTHVNIDGDVILYAVGFAAQATEYHVDGKQFDAKLDATDYCDKYNLEHSDIDVAVRPEPVEHCLSSVKRMLKRIVEESEAVTSTVLLSGSANFRTEVATIQPYKGNRKADKPYHYGNIRNYLLNVHRAHVCEGEEADDQLSIRACVAGHTIATIDKDLDNTAGWHYNWNTKVLYEVTPVEADRNFYKQLLTGDATDNIPGLYRITGTRASAAMKARIDEEREPAAMYDIVFSIYKEALQALEEEDRTVSITNSNVASIIQELGRLLWMRRTENELWQRPKQNQPTTSSAQQ